MAPIPVRSRRASPYLTTCSTARYTLSQLTPNITAVCCHDSSRAHRERNTANAVVIGLLPPASHQGTHSTFTPHLRHSIRRSPYTSTTAIPDRKSTRLNSSHLGIS